MNKTKIHTYQFFVLLVLFELGSAIVIPLGSEAKQDAWISILLGMMSGFFLCFIYLKLFQYYPDKHLIAYLPDIIGTFLGKFIGTIYVVYFIYIAARVLRDFGIFLISSTYHETPLFTILLVMIFTIIYCLRKGFEVLARLGELFFVLTYFLLLIVVVLLFSSGIMDINNLKPILKENLSIVFKVTLTQTLYIPFGELIVFTMILPSLNQPDLAKKAGLAAIILSGLTIASVIAFNIMALGTDIISRSAFPLLTTIQHIKIANFLERLDIVYMTILIIGVFFKISIFFYGGLIGLASLFQIENHNKLTYPLGVITLLIAMGISSNFAEHIKEGLDFVPIYLHLPLQVIIPFLLLMIISLKHVFKTKRTQKIS